MHSGSRRLRDFAGHFRRLAGLAALAAYLAATVGLPLPSRPAKDRSRPFACMDRACGCMSAEECWRGCCCFTGTEKLAWAAAHHVEPPSFVLAAQPCCNEHADDCHVDPAAHVHRVRPASGHERTTRWVNVSQWRHCHGQAPLWSVLGAVAPPPALVSWEFQWTLVSRLSSPSIVAPTLTYPPPLPPPRV